MPKARARLGLGNNRLAPPQDRNVFQFIDALNGDKSGCSQRLTIKTLEIDLKLKIGIGNKLLDVRRWKIDR